MDSRFPTYYMNDRRILRLTPDQFRFFVLATAWSVSNMTDGRIDHEDLYLIPFATEGEVEALVKAGLWEVREGGWMIVDFVKTQTSAAKMETAMANRLAKDRERAQKARDKKREEGSSHDASRDDHVSFERQREEEEAEAKATQGKALDVSPIPTKDADAIWGKPDPGCSLHSVPNPEACWTCEKNHQGVAA